MEFQPAVYEHAAQLIGRRPWEVSRSAELLFEAHAAAYAEYHHVPITVGIDVYNLEAEAYGAPVSEPNGNGIPAITTHPFAEVGDLVDLEPFDPSAAGRIPLVFEAAARLKERYPHAEIRVPVSGPFSTASNLVGFETLLTGVLSAPGIVSRALERIASGQIAFSEAIAARGISFTVFESAAAPPLLSPAMFREILLPALRRLIDTSSAIVGRRAACIIGGDTLPILDSVMATNPGYIICPAETDQAPFMEAMERFPEVMVRLNMKPDVFTLAETGPALAEADRALAIASPRRKVCIGSGALPFEARPETVHRVKEYVERAR